MNMSKAFNHVGNITAALNRVHTLVSGNYNRGDLEAWQLEVKGLMDILNDKTHTVRAEVWVWLYDAPPGMEEEMAARALSGLAAAWGLTIDPKAVARKDGQTYKLALDYEAYEDGTAVVLMPTDLPDTPQQ